MKKVILGTGLLIFGELIILAEYLRNAIYFASQITTHPPNAFQPTGIVILLCGIVLNIWGFIKKDKKE